MSQPNALGAIEAGATLTVANATGAELPIYRRVKHAGTYATGNIPNVALAGVDDNALGVTRKPIAASGGRGTILAENGNGMQIGTASGAIGAGVPVYAAAAGMITATADANRRVGTSGAAAADGEAVNYYVVPTGVKMAAA